jgi:hypothetical protein
VEYRAGTLQEERKKRLLSIGFEFDAKLAQSVRESVMMHRQMN